MIGDGQAVAPTDLWLDRPRPAPDASLRIVAVPHAGGGPSAILPLAEALAPEIEVWTAQLPGRERRYGEPLAESLGEIVRPLAAAIAAHVPAPYVLFGHSMGALVSFEIARQLPTLGAPPPERLIVSAQSAPHLSRTRPARHTLPDSDLLAWLSQVGGAPQQVLRDEDLMRLLLPILRADLRICETYRYRPGPPVPCPVTAIAGSDDPQAEMDDVAAWWRHTSAGFDLRPMPGGHFYHLDTGWPGFLTELTAVLRARGTEPPSVEPSGTEPHVAEPLVADLIKAQARRTPDAIAVIDGPSRYSYRHLVDRAERWSAALGTAGVRPGDVVAIYADRSIDLPAALVGALLADATFLPLDPSYPAERLGYMLADSGASTIVTQPDLIGRLPEAGRPVTTVTADDLPARPSTRDGRRRPPATATAYLLYTSGSTGAPKGTLVPQGALTRLFADFAPRLGLGSHDVVLAQTPLSFDISMVELLLPLTVGASIHLVDPAVAADGPELAAQIQRAGVTFVQGTPTTLRMLLAAGWTASPEVTVLSGGEALPPDLATRLLRDCGQLWNGYGPTETAVYSVADRVRSGQVTIGEPLAGEQAYLLDEWGDPVPVGEAGELHLGGDGLAHGYLGRAALTAERFLPDPFAPRPGRRMYRTGDLARQRPDGRIEYLGRLDHQVKLRGYRIEPGEIEAALRDHPGVRDAVAKLGARETDQEPMLLAYLVLTGPEPTREALRRHLRRTLPDFMVPAQFLVVDELPLTPSGKIDRGRVEGGKPLAAEVCEPPGTATEQVLAGLWLDLIGLDDLGVTESVFAAGADSLLAMRAAAVLVDIFRIPVAVRTLFERPSVREQGRYLAAATDAEKIADQLVRLATAEGEKTGTAEGEKTGTAEGEKVGTAEGEKVGTADSHNGGER